MTLLEDTLIGIFLPAFRKRIKRLLIQAPRFIFFDIGIVSQLTHCGEIKEGSELFGKAFKHFILMEVTAYCSYFNRRYLLSYWQTGSQREVDLIVGDHLALKIKSTDRVHDRHLKGLRAFKEEHQVQGKV